MKISIYKNIRSTVPIVQAKAVLKVLEEIRNGNFKKQIAKIRIEPDKNKRNELKQNLENATFCGVFTARGINGLKYHSGLAMLDFDAADNLPELTKQVNSDKFTFSSFISPSGNGLKVLVKIPKIDNNDDYNDYYVELVKHYSQYGRLDSSTKDISRASYLSYDENLYLNTESEIFTDKFNRPILEKHEKVNIPVTDQNEIAERLDKWFQKRWSSTNRNCNLHAYARQMNAFGVDIHTCEMYLFRYEQPDFTQKEIRALIKSAYRYTAEYNTRHFEDEKTVKLIKNLVLSGETKEGVKSKINGISGESISVEFDKHSNTIKNDEFWFYTERNQIRLASFRFLTYLESNNIFKFYPDATSGAYLFVKIENNFLSLFDENKIKDFVLNDLRKRGIIDAFELMADNTQAFNPKYLSMIKTIELNFNRDKFDTSFIYYNNGVVKTTANNIELLKYSEIKDTIWKDQIIDRDFKLKDESEGVFKTFIWKVSGENVERYYTLKSVIGYLMHSYQNDAKPKAIIFNDEMISDDLPNGGSGKGLIHKAIGYIKNIVIEDGKKFDPRSQFAYQKINKDTQIVLFDDVPKNFVFETLFSIVTEGMTVEKKGKDAFKIPFKESPKISITTNYTVKGSGASFYRRVFEVEIANYFNDRYTPEDEFKHQFFSDWDESEWQKFDNFMIRCIQYFLKNGLVESNKVNLKFRKLQDDLGTEFIEFMESRNFDGTPIGKKELRDEFFKNYPHVAKFNTAQRFNRKVYDYCNYYNIECKEGKYNGTVIFYINKNEVKESDPF